MAAKGRARRRTLSEPGTPYASLSSNDPEEPVKHRVATTILILSSLGLPVTATAQFTTFVAPPRKPAVDSAKAIIAEHTARGDSVKPMSLSDMKAWVDSAAGVSGNPQVAVADTTTVESRLPPTTSAPALPAPTTTFSDGAIAPNTASALPALALGGVVLLVAGGALLTLRSRGDQRS